MINKVFKYHPKNVLLILIGVLLIPNTMVTTPRLGLDPSWALTVNLALVNNRTFGDDYVFTYGPLGFLLTRLAIGLSKYSFLLYDIVLWALTMFVIKYALNSNLRMFGVLIVILMILFGQGFDPLVVYLFLCFYLIKTGNIFAIIFAGVLSSVYFFIKINIGLVSVLIYYLTIIFAVALKKINYYEAVVGFCANLLCLTLGSIFLNVNLYGYILGAYHLVTGYTPMMHKIISFVLYIGYAAFCSTLRKWDRSSRTAWLALMVRVSSPFGLIRRPAL